MKKALLGLLLVVLAAVAGAYGGRWYIVSEMRKPILATLNDPDSAKFRSETLSSPWSVKGSVLCGEVNAKNRMGGYIGYRAFYVSTLAGEVIVEMNEQWAKSRCGIENDLRSDDPWWHIRW